MRNQPLNAKPVGLWVGTCLIGICSSVWTDEPVPKPGTDHPLNPGYKLVWQEEFPGEKLDRRRWRVQDDTVTGQYGHGNGEAQVYLDAEGKTFHVRDGKLTIVASYAPGKKYPLRDNPNGPVLKHINHQPFRSAKLTTENLARFTYGIFEARIKNSSGGKNRKTAIPSWPAFWLLPEAASAPYRGYWDRAEAARKRDSSLSAWPYSGEIDVMEMSGRATRLYHAGAVYHDHPTNWTVGHLRWHSHYRRFDGVIDPRQWIARQKLDPKLQPTAGEGSYPQDYHVYGCQWTPKKIVFTFDGKPWGPALDLTDKTKFGGRQTYNGYPFYLILNQAVGGKYFGVWGPNDPGPDRKGKNELYDFALFPQSMHVDWVRVYQKK